MDPRLHKFRKTETLRERVNDHYVEFTIWTCKKCSAKLKRYGGAKGHPSKGEVAAHKIHRNCSIEVVRSVMES